MLAHAGVSPLQIVALLATCLPERVFLRGVKHEHQPVGLGHVPRDGTLLLLHPGLETLARIVVDPEDAACLRSRGTCGVARHRIDLEQEWLGQEFRASSEGHPRVPVALKVCLQQPHLRFGRRRLEELGLVVPDNHVGFRVGIVDGNAKFVEQLLRLIGHRRQQV